MDRIGSGWTADIPVGIRTADMSDVPIAVGIMAAGLDNPFSRL
jgi:hypothetical protein